MGSESIAGLPPAMIKFAGTHLYTWVERGTVRVKCLAQEHNKVDNTFKISIKRRVTQLREIQTSFKFESRIGVNLLWENPTLAGWAFKTDSNSPFVSELLLETDCTEQNALCREDAITFYVNVHPGPRPVRVLWYFQRDTETNFSYFRAARSSIECRGT